MLWPGRLWSESRSSCPRETEEDPLLWCSGWIIQKQQTTATWSSGGTWGVGTRCILGLGRDEVVPGHGGGWPDCLPSSLFRPSLVPLNVSFHCHSGRVCLSMEMCTSSIGERERDSKAREWPRYPNFKVTSLTPTDRHNLIIKIERGDARMALQDQRVW